MKKNGAADSYGTFEDWFEQVKVVLSRKVESRHGHRDVIFLKSEGDEKSDVDLMIAEDYSNLRKWNFDTNNCIVQKVFH